MAISIVGLFALMLMGAVGIACVLLLVRAFSPGERSPREHAQLPHRQRSGAGPAVALLLAGGIVLLGLIAVRSWSTVARHESARAVARVSADMDSRQAGIRSERIETVSREAVPEDGQANVDLVREDGAVDQSDLPAWTKTPERTLVEGQVPTVRRVVQSGLYATQEEATRAAALQVQRELRDRLSESYPQFASWTIPATTVETYSIKQRYVEERETQFGEFREPMYQVWLQYEDSPHVRDPIIAEWERSAVAGRSQLFVVGAGLLALLLGTVSAGTRAMMAPRGKRGRAGFATVALGTAAGLAAALLFVA